MTIRYGFHGRANFGGWLNARGLTGEGVEVGVHRGVFAAELLSSWRGTYTGVDHYPGGYDPDDPAARGDRQADKDAACAALRPYVLAFRATLLYLPSPQASAEFEDRSLDFVYIDGKHRAADVYADLAAWWPKVRTAGVLAGHDFICPGMEARGGGWAHEVQTAVVEWAHAQNIPSIFLVTEPPDGEEWSFYIVKPARG